VDEYRIDSHKLMYHVPRVNDWLTGKDIYPIYCEVGLTDICNQRCIFCGLDYMHTDPHVLETKPVKRLIGDAAKRGLKSIMFAGEGEPLLHKDCSLFIHHAKKCGVDVALVTNGALMDKRFLEESLSELTWIKISLDAATASSYRSIHGVKGDEFARVVDNIQRAVSVRKRMGLPVTIGVQLLLLNQNYREVCLLAQKAKKWGVDYLAVKPYSKHPLSRNNLASDLDYSYSAPPALTLRVRYQRRWLLKKYVGRFSKYCLSRSQDRQRPPAQTHSVRTSGAISRFVCVHSYALPRIYYGYPFRSHLL